MISLAFIRDIDEYDKQVEYVQTLVRILITELQDGGGWRTSQTADLGNSEPWVCAKAGYITKLENEGVIERTYDSNNYTHYQLTDSPSALRDALTEYKRFLDDNYQDALENADTGDVHDIEFDIAHVRSGIHSYLDS